MKVYEAVVMLHPTEDEKKAGKVAYEIALPKQRLNAKDERAALVQVGMYLAVTKITTDTLGVDLHDPATFARLEVLVRPF